MDPDLIRTRLAEPGTRAAELGFRGADRDDLVALTERVLRRAAELDAVAALATVLARRVGRFDPGPEDEFWADHPETAEGLCAGALPMLALFATAPEVTAWQAERGISAEDSAAALADLGQQVWVHRRTFGEFGLHTHRWLGLIWTGALYRLGRLQFNLQRTQLPGVAATEPPPWVLSTHIPRSGPLDPASVDASLAAAETFFARHFPDHRPTGIHCRSWLLDPRLPELLPGTNLAAFQRRWRLFDEPADGDADVLFFVFGRLGAVDLDELEPASALQRVALEQLRSARPWALATGYLADR